MEKEEYLKSVALLKSKIENRMLEINNHCNAAKSLREQNEKDTIEIEDLENSYLFGTDIAWERIERYIEQCEYTWTYEQLKIEYSKFINGVYISHTCEEIITRYSKECKELFG